VKIASRLGVLCRSSLSVHDIVVYGEDGAVRYMQYSEPTAWTPPTNRGGKFVGEPVVVKVNGERLDFFGIGEDKHMYPLYLDEERGLYSAGRCWRVVSERAVCCCHGAGVAGGCSATRHE